MPTNRQEYNRAYKRKWRRTHLLAGQCAVCNKPRAPDSSQSCPEHVDYQAKYQAARVKKCLAAGVCVICREPLSPASSRHCEKHKLAHCAWMREYRKKRAAAGNPIGRKRKGQASK